MFACRRSSPEELHSRFAAACSSLANAGLREPATAREPCRVRFVVWRDIPLSSPAEGSPRFTDFGLSERMLAALKSVEYDTATPIQAALLPIALTGCDCTGQAQTGTGKTAAFVIPIVERIDPAAEGTQAIILCPTRELSEQVAAEARRLAREHDINPVLLVGG